MWPESGVMSIMGARASVFAAIGIGLVAAPADAAEITVNSPDQDGREFVDIVGDIEAGDDKTFRKKVGVLADPEKVVVTLTSDGGDFVTAFLVGDHIRLTGMTTFVPAGKTCASACAFVWLAGRPRTFGSAHASASTASTMQELGNNRACPMPCSAPTSATSGSATTRSFGWFPLSLGPCAG
jgi:hypothetical protein